MNLFGIIIFSISIFTLTFGYLLNLFPKYLFRNRMYQIVILVILLIEVHNYGWIGIMQTLICVLLSVAYLLSLQKGYASKSKNEQENQ